MNPSIETRRFAEIQSKGGEQRFRARKLPLKRFLAIQLLQDPYPFFREVDRKNVMRPIHFRRAERHMACELSGFFRSRGDHR